jgi:hypothetical protein
LFAFAAPAFIKAAITLALSPENKLRIPRGTIVTRYRGDKWSQGNLQRELRLAHSLGVLARDVDKRIHWSIPENVPQTFQIHHTNGGSRMIR